MAGHHWAWLDNAAPAPLPSLHPLGNRCFFSMLAIILAPAKSTLFSPEGRNLNLIFQWRLKPIKGPKVPLPVALSSSPRVGAGSRSLGRSGHVGGSWGHRIIEKNQQIVTGAKDHQVLPSDTFTINLHSLEQNQEPSAAHRPHCQQCPHPCVSSDHLLADEAAEDRNLHSLSSIVESIAVEDVAVTFPEARGQN